MDSMPSAVSLARALLLLSRARRTGVLHIATEFGACRVAVVAGVPRAATALPGFAQPLGDALLADGALDPYAHAEALRASEHAHGPVGRWLVDAGLVSRPALELALRRQLRDRVLQVFACHSLDYRFEPGEPDVGARWIEEPVCTADLVLAALRSVVAGWPYERLIAVVDPGALQLNATGAVLVRGAALWPEESAAASLLRGGATLVAVLRATFGADRALRFVAALSLLSALMNASSREQRYSLLVRKREQLRRAAGPHALLELPAHTAPGEARRSLRRLARALHPDALGPDAPDALRRASCEVLAALSVAEQSLRERAQ
jgi:hypothetical protein